ncbi:MAG: HAMP domain-containing sensor histidine kinase [Clostridiaceae bacterium]|nr:HAMP domain-containing sensor histidine kinase [Clostridiaceae bacterium]
MGHFFRWINDAFLSRRLDLRVRLFNVLAMAGALVSLVFTVFNIIAKSPVNIASSFAGAVLSVILLVYATRTRRYQLAYIITVIGVFLILFPVMFFTAGGYRYGMISYFTFAIAFTIFMLEGKKSLLLAGLELLVYIALCFFAHAHPERINYYETNPDTFWGVLMCFFTASVALGIAMYMHFKLYNEQQRELEAARQKLSDENAALERVNQLKTEFLANISHELRTPLTVVSGYAQTARTELSELPEVKSIADIMTLIASESERMSLMVGQILDVTRIDENRMVFVPAPCSLAEVIQKTLSTYYPILNKNNNKLSLKLPEDLPEASADTVRVSQVLVNLIANAIRHTNKGQIIVSAAAQGDFIEISVADNGEGIAPERIPLLFERYKSRDSAKAQAGRSTGTGLGLFICKHIVEAHGGRIWIESVMGAGTTVRFTLPKASESTP